MQRFKIVGLALMAVFALGAVVSATASALPTLLEKNKKPVSVIEKFTGESGKTNLVKLNGKEVECATSTSEGQFEKESVLGPFHITFSNCTAKEGIITAKCTGAGDKTAGVILVLGEAHLVYDVLTPTLGAAVLFLIPQFHFTCEAFGVKKLILVKGEVLCLIKPINTLAKHFEIKCEQSKGDPLETKYWNEAGTEVNTLNGLLASESASTTEEKFEMSGEEGSGLILTELEVEIMA